jgi:hypothetical protein
LVDGKSAVSKVRPVESTGSVSIKVKPRFSDPADSLYSILDLLVYLILSPKALSRRHLANKTRINTDRLPDPHHGFLGYCMNISAIYQPKNKVFFHSGKPEAVIKQTGQNSLFNLPRTAKFNLW